MMKKILSMFALVTMLGLGFTATSFAEDAAPAANAAATAPAAESTPAAPAAAPAEAAPAQAAAAPAPVPNKGDTAWMLISTVLVTLMVIPGLALFYGGLVRQKNMLSVLMQVFMIFSLMSVLWAIYGYSVAFTGGSPFFGGLSKAFLAGITPDSLGATFSKGVYLLQFFCSSNIYPYANGCRKYNFNTDQ